jgi:succinate dehydrogenase / fumarate reductase membrane anchor subunit
MTVSTGSPPPMRTPLGHVRGLGSARAGTHHFWATRVTAVALVPLTIAFVVIVIALLGRNHAAAVQILGSPLVAILMILFVATGVYHMWLGMQEIVVDYVHGELLKLVTLMANTFFALALGIACAFAILKLSFGV